MDKREKRRDPEQQTSEAPMSDEEIDVNLEETFPASDPPSWTMGVDRDHDPGKKKPEKQDERKKKAK